MGWRTIGLESSGLGRAWPAGTSLSHRTQATPVAGQVQCTLTRSLGLRCFLFSSDTLVRLASGLDALSVKKQCGLVALCFGGRMALDLRLSRVRTGVVAMRQDSNYYYYWHADSRNVHQRLNDGLTRPKHNPDDAGPIVRCCM
jgi:hypothetical protein